MNNSRIFLILGVVLITLISAVLCGCTGQTTSSTDTPASPTTATNTNSNDNNVPSGVTAKDGVTTMAGSKTDKFPFHSEEGGYKLVFKS